jgi:hypothetical protein
LKPLHVLFRLSLAQFDASDCVRDGNRMCEKSQARFCEDFIWVSAEPERGLAAGKKENCTCWPLSGASKAAAQRLVQRCLVRSSARPVAPKQSRSGRCCPRSQATTREIYSCPRHELLQPARYSAAHSRALVPEAVNERRANRRAAGRRGEAGRGWQRLAEAAH